MAGSHNVRRRRPEEGRFSIYWDILGDEGVLNLLTDLCDEEHSVILFGELYGGGIQDMDYGSPQKVQYAIFDISIDGCYLDWTRVLTICKDYGLQTVPLLYEGPYSHEIVEQYTYGPTTLANPEDIRCNFKDREGCVVTPMEEQFYAPTGDRLILKSVSADYLGRKGGTDNE